MTRQELLIAQIAEEATEVAQEAIKALRFGLTDDYSGPTVAERLARELNDLMGVVSMVDGLDHSIIHSSVLMESKRIKVEKMLEYSRSIGRLTDARDPKNTENQMIWHCVECGATVREGRDFCAACDD